MYKDFKIIGSSENAHEDSDFSLEIDDVVSINEVRIYCIDHCISLVIESHSRDEVECLLINDEGEIVENIVYDPDDYSFPWSDYLDERNKIVNLM